MVELKLTEEQAEVVSTACEFFARIKIGQFNEIIWALLDAKLSADEYCSRREKAQELLLDARKQIYPDLNGVGHSYGMGKFEDADIAFDVHQVLRYVLGDPREPWSMTALPKCTLKPEEYTTNADTIRSMDDEKLASFFVDAGWDCHHCSEHERLSDNPLMKEEKCDENCAKHCLDWLRKRMA